LGIPLDEILSLEGNKYEKTAAVIKYIRYLAQKNDDQLEIPVGRNRNEKLTIVAMNDILRGKVSYELEAMPDE
jgi:DNA-directed RNA polymerase subunit K/omega